MLSTIISIISGIVFALTYFMSPKEVAAEYSAIALVIALGIEIIIKYFFIARLSKFAWLMYATILCFTIPAIVFNDLLYIQIKFYLFKVIFIIVNLVLMYKFNFNIMQKTLSFIIPKVSAHGWFIINYIFIFYLLIALCMGLIAQLAFNDRVWVLTKGILIPILGGTVMVLIIAYGCYDIYKQKKSVNKM